VITHHLIVGLALVVQAATGDTVAIEHVTVLPMDRDTALVDHTVVTAGDRIVWIGPSSAARLTSTVRRIDGRAGYLMPGLADMHVHLQRVEELPAYVAAGVTTVRNMHGSPLHLHWRNQVASGRIVGPRIFTAGPAISDHYVRLPMPADAEHLVREQSAARYDMIKVLNDIALPVYDRLLQAAKAAQIPVVGHIAEGIGSARALTAGQVSIEHANIHMFEGGRSRLDEGARAIAQTGAWVGTLIAGQRGRCDPPTDEQRAIIGALRRANVKMLPGTDATLGGQPPGRSLNCELRMLVRAGLTPYDVLSAATRNAGEFARLHLKEQVSFGTVTVGSRADLVVFPSDPRADLVVLDRPVGTMLRGTWLPRGS
jgi:imidazolonepropionase-like amidohydrolase